MVAIRRTVGKAENSSGLLIHRATIRISTEIAIDIASPISMMNFGIGRNRIVRIKTMPAAKLTSIPRRCTSPMPSPATA